MQARFDPNGTYILRMPRESKYEAIFEVARRFVAKEESLPAGQRTPYAARVAAMLAQAGELTTQKRTGEAERTASSEAVKRLEAEAQGFARQVQGMLAALYPKEPERAEAWGLNLKQGTRLVQLPRNRAERRAFLAQYVAHEESLPDGERFPTPKLAEVQRVRDELASYLDSRSAGRTRREGGVAGSHALAKPLLDTLQAAAVHLLANTFDFTVTPDLEQWGFDVVEREPPKEEKPK